MGAAIGGPFAPAGVFGIIGGGTGYYYSSEADKKYLIGLVNNLIMLKKRNERGPRSTSSEISRKFFFPYIINCIKEFIDVDKVVEIYSLHVFKYSELSMEKIVSYFRDCKYDKALDIGILPVGFENYNNQIGEVITIHTEHTDYFAILYDNENEGTYNPILKYWEQQEEKN